MTNDYTNQLLLPVPTDKVYHAVATEEGVRHWWTQFTGIGNEVGSNAEFHFPKARFFVKAEIQSVERNQLVEWKVIDSLHPESSGFSNLRDWEGTVIRFEIEKISDAETVLNFTHSGLNQELECYQVCERGWTSYLTSLKEYLVNGKGKPYTDNTENNIKQM